MRRGCLYLLLVITIVVHAWAEQKYVIPAEYGPKKAVLITVVCNQILSGPEEYLTKTISYALTRTDVYLEICPDVIVNGVQPIDLVNLDNNQFKVLHKGYNNDDQSKWFLKKTIHLFELIAQQHGLALQSIQGQSHRLLMYNNNDLGEKYPFIRDRSLMAVQKPDASLFFLNTVGKESGMAFYLQNFINSEQVKNIQTMPLYLQPSALVMDQKNIFMSSSYLRIYETKADAVNCAQAGKEVGELICNDGFENVMHEYFDFDRLIQLETNLNESTSHIDTLIKFVLNPITQKTEVLLGVSQAMPSATAPKDHPMQVMKWEIDSYHENKNRDRRNKTKLEGLGYIVHEIPNSGIYGNNKAKQFTLGYINSLSLGDVVLVPQYISDYMYSAYDLKRRAQDHQNAIRVYQKFYKYVISVPIQENVRNGNGGSLHCLTSDIP